MPVFDQFDVEPVNSFESSSSDRIFFGSVFNQSSSLMSFQNSPRYVFGGKIEKFNDAIIDTVGLWRFSDWDAYKSASFFPTFSRANQIFESENVFYDSQPPNIQDFLVRNNCFSFGYLDQTREVVNQPRLDLDISQKIILIIVPYKGNGNIYHSFPFQSEFADIARLTNSTDFFVTSSLTGSNNDILVEFDKLVFFSYRDPINDNLIIVDTTASFLQGQDFSNINGNLEDGSSYPIRINDLYKVIYGFGDGLGLEIVNQNWALTQFYNQYPSFKRFYFPDPDWLLLPVIRGFRYGMIHHVPLSRKHHFNRNHYGYLSDKFESDPYSTMASEGNIDNICAVSFVSGSAAAYSASLNSSQTRNTGLYNQYYRSSKPFIEG